MEFRCRLGTPGGEVLEGVYVSDSEDRLRRELEEKGLYILSLQRRTGLQTAVSFGGGRRGRIGRQEFLVFNQELATLLKAGMPLVQSLDILRQRVSNLTFRGALDTIYDSTNLQTNQYTAIFAEDGWAMLQMCPDSRLYEVALDPSGVVGCCPPELISF